MLQNNRYYNYMLLDPRKPYKWKYQDLNINYEPFYIGKGTGNRITAHYTKSCDDNPYTKHKIEKLKNGGYAKLYIKYNENSLEQDAFAEEINSIKYIKENYPEFKLTNMTDGGDAPPIQSGKDNFKSIPVYQYDPDSGEFIKGYESALQASKSFDSITAGHILECCKGKRKTAFNYIWRFEKVPKIKIEQKKYDRIRFSKLIAYKDNEIHEFKSMKDAYAFLGVPNKGRINSVLKGERNTYKGYYWKIEK